MRNPRAKIIPGDPKPNDVVEVKAIITHVMETGSRKNRHGKLVPRHIIHTFSAKLDGREVFRADLHPGIAANPYLSFRLRVVANGMLVLTWIDDSGETAVLEVPVTVQ